MRRIWIAVAAAGFVTAVSLGVRSTFGILIDPIVDGLGTDRGSIALAIAIQNLMWGFSQPIAGAISDRFGAARTLAGGALLYALAMFLMSTATSSGMVLLSGGFLAGIAIGAASFAVALSAVGRMAPPEKRSLMLGVVSAVGSLGQFVLIPIANQLLENGDWQGTARAMAVILLPILLVAPFVRRELEQQATSAASPVAAYTLTEDLRRAAGSASYLMLNGAFFVCGFHVTFIGIHLAGYVGDLGVSTRTASTALALIGLFNVFGSLFVGWLGGRMAFTAVLAWIYGLRAVAIAAFVLVPLSATTTIVFGMVIGTLWLATVPMTSAIVTQQFGPANSGALFGIVFLSHQLGSFIGAWMGGEVVDATGSYQAAWWTAIALGIAAMILHLLIDESPLPDPPASSRGMRVVPGAAALLFVVIASAGMWATASPLVAASVDGRTGAVATHCSLVLAS